MDQCKKFLTGCLTAVMVLGMTPTAARAATVSVVEEPTHVFDQVYGFDENNTAVVRVETEDGWVDATVTVTDAGLSEPVVTDDARLEAFYDEAAGLWGYKDTAGNVVIPAVYDDYWSYMPSLDEPLIMEKDGMYGIIDSANNVLIPFHYDSIYALSTPGYYKGTSGELETAALPDVCIFTVTGDVVIPFGTYDDISELWDCPGYYEVSSGGLRGIVDVSGNVVVSLGEYDYFESDFLSDETTIFWGYRGESEYLFSGRNGQLLGTVPAGYRSTTYFYGADLCAVMDGETEQYGYMDVYGNVVIPALFDDGEGFYGDVTYVGMKVDGEDGIPTTKYALLNDQGILLTDYEFEYAYAPAIGDGLIEYVEFETYKSGFINTSGEVVIPARYDLVTDFANGIAVVGQYEHEGHDMKLGMIDTAGNVILPLIYDDIGDAVSYYTGESPYVWVMQWDEDLTPHYGVAKVDPNAPSPIPTAYARTQSVLVNGTPVEFQAYALKDPTTGYETNYVKLRDVAHVLNGTAAQFNVGWDGAVNITPNTPYEANGSEMDTPYTGDRAYETSASDTKISGEVADLDAILLKDDKGNGYTYYKLRDLGDALGFVVDWTAETGITINT